VLLQRLLLLLAAVSLMWSAPAKRRAAATPPDLSHATVIADVTVVDVETGTLDPHRNVYIQGEKIVSVAPASKPHPGAHTVPGAGKFLIPGLWDMHVHLWDPDPQFRAYLAHGVTGVRDMGSNFTQMRAWRNQIEHGSIAGPRIFTSGPPLDGPGETSDPRLSARVIHNAEEARRAFDELDDMHVDFIEVLPGLHAEAFFALTEFTRHWGHRIAGNLPDSVTAKQAVDARQGSIEDLEGILLSCSSDERDLRSQWRDAKRANDIPALEKVAQVMVDTYSKRKAALLFSDMRIYEVLATPLLTARKRTAMIQIEYDRLAPLIKDMADGGVGFLSGTDTGLADTKPGAELHDELELMAQAGLTPVQVLRAATLHPARALRHQADLGTIHAGKYADLVLLDENPLIDIANTRKIAGVFANGRYLAKHQLAKTP
jgi:imidazolonepropionase-like amidohydrolase